MGYSSTTRCAIFDINGIGSLRNAAITWRGQWDTRKLENRVSETFECSQSQVKYAFNDQGGFNGDIGVNIPPTTAAVMFGATPRLNGMFINPEGQRTSIDQSLVVLRPIGNFTLRLTHFDVSHSHIGRSEHANSKRFIRI